MDDSQIIREIKNGNIELYRELMQKYERKMISFIYHMLKSARLEALAEDLSQETFYKAFRSLGTFREVEASFSTWLYTIARNTVLSELRKNRTLNISFDETGDMLVDDDRAQPEQEMLRNERVWLVREAIDNLPERQRSALILREYEQLDYQEISIVLGQSVSAVKSLLFRARSSIKKQLQPYYEEPNFKEIEGMT